MLSFCSILMYDTCISHERTRAHTSHDNRGKCVPTRKIITKVSCAWRKRWVLVVTWSLCGIHYNYFIIIRMFIKQSRDAVDEPGYMGESSEKSIAISSKDKRRPQWRSMEKHNSKEEQLCSTWSEIYWCKLTGSQVVDMRKASALWPRWAFAWGKLPKCGSPVFSRVI